MAATSDRKYDGFETTEIEGRLGKRSKALLSTRQNRDRSRELGYRLRESTTSFDSPVSSLRSHRFCRIGVQRRGTEGHGGDPVDEGNDGCRPAVPTAVFVRGARSLRGPMHLSSQAFGPFDRHSLQPGSVPSEESDQVGNAGDTMAEPPTGEGPTIAIDDR